MVSELVIIFNVYDCKIFSKIFEAEGRTASLATFRGWLPWGLRRAPVQDEKRVFSAALLYRADFRDGGEIVFEHALYALFKREG